MRLASATAAAMLLMSGPESAPIAPAAPVDTDAPPPPSAQQVLIAMADRVGMGSSASVVEGVTRALGKPTLRFDWCNGAGCVESTEARATSLRVSWVVKDGDAQLVLHIKLCRNFGRWRASSSAVYRDSGKRGAWGTRAGAELEQLFLRNDPELERSCVAGR